MREIYRAKSILNVHKHCDGGWFWTKYSASPYVGCQYGCEYCYSREEKYHPHSLKKNDEVSNLSDSFSEYIRIKENAQQLLRREMKKKPPDLICLDSYQPIETEYRYARKMLEVCLELNFPVFINEKSPLLLRDLDVLEKISKKSFLNVGWSIIAAMDDEAKSIFEPNTPPFSARFEAMKKLTEAGITCGTIFMPVLPFIYDKESMIEAVIKKTKEYGGQYVLEGGLSLHGGCKTNFYKALDKFDPALATKYNRLYGEPDLLIQQNKRVHKSVLEYCQKYGILSHIPRPVKIYPEELQINKKIAEIFYLEARELQISGQDSYREWAYRKAAWAIDNLKKGLQTTFREKGIDGLLEIKGIGKNIAKHIGDYLETIATRVLL